MDPLSFDSIKAQLEQMGHAVPDDVIASVLRDLSLAPGADQAVGQDALSGTNFAVLTDAPVSLATGAEPGAPVPYAPVPAPSFQLDSTLPVAVTQHPWSGAAAGFGSAGGSLLGNAAAAPGADLEALLQPAPVPAANPLGLLFEGLGRAGSGEATAPAPAPAEQPAPPSLLPPALEPALPAANPAAAAAAAAADDLDALFARLDRAMGETSDTLEAAAYPAAYPAAHPATANIDTHAYAPAAAYGGYGSTAAYGAASHQRSGSSLGGYGSSGSAGYGAAHLLTTGGAQGHQRSGSFSDVADALEGGDDVVLVQDVRASVVAAAAAYDSEREIPEEERARLAAAAPEALKVSSSATSHNSLVSPGLLLVLMR